MQRSPRADRPLLHRWQSIQQELRDRLVAVIERDRESIATVIAGRRHIHHHAQEEIDRFDFSRGYGVMERGAPAEIRGVNVCYERNKRSHKIDISIQRRGHERGQAFVVG